MKRKTKLLIIAFFSFMYFSCKKEKLINEQGNLVPKTVIEDNNLPAITVNGIRLHSEAWGHPHNNLIVVIHGGPGGDYREMLNCKDLAEQGFRVIFYDQRGSGLSQRLSKSKYVDNGVSTLDTFYNELRGVINHYNKYSDQKVFLLGHSWGAMLATGFTGKYPELVDGLISSEPGGLIWEDVIEYIKESRDFNLFSETSNNATYPEQFISAKQDHHAVLDYKFALLVSKNTITGEGVTEKLDFWRNGAVVNSAMNEIGIKYEPNFSSGIIRFNKPVLFFYSEKNKVYSDNWAKKISSSYKSVITNKVSGVGHSGIIANKNAWKNTVMPKILSYLNSVK